MSRNRRHSAMPRTAISRTVGSVLCLLISIFVAIWFTKSLISTFTSNDPGEKNCRATAQDTEDGNFSYLQLDLLEQHPAEPYFNATIFANLGHNADRQLTRLVFTRSGDSVYYPSTINMDMWYSPDAQTVWARKAMDVELTRISGAHRNFPFDSAQFSFDISYTPPVVIHNYFIRNQNPSFDVPCASYYVQRLQPGKIHITFEAQRNRLVQLTAVVLVGAGFLFALAIVVFVKSDSLPTSVASYFFSLWSIRAILSSEMKIFPTVLDLALLSLCVLLLVALGIRLALKELPRK